jgi:ComF family protein
MSPGPVGFLRRLHRAALRLLYPPRCQLCECFCPTPLCQACAESFARITQPWCLRCGAPFDPRVKARPCCAECAEERRPPLDRVRSLGLHVGPLRDAVNALKFRGRIRLALPLAHLLVSLFGASEAGLLEPALIDSIVPVPLHPARRRWRGYDQAELLGRELSTVLDTPCRQGWLRRLRNTPPQVGQPRKARERNVRGAFAAKEPWPAPGARVLLIDDVYTTGATVRECARMLRRAGAEAVYAVTVSRAAPAWHPQADLVQDA